MPRAESVLAPVMLAETRPVDRQDVDRGQRWTAYRVRQLSSKEYDQRRAAGELPFGAGRYVLEERHSRTDGDTFQGGDWRIWDHAETADKAVCSCLGDSNYTAAVSLHLAHATAVRTFRDRVAAREAAGKLVAERVQTEVQRLDVIRASNAKYAKSKRTGRALEKYAERLRAEYGPAIHVLEERVKELGGLIATAEELLNSLPEPEAMNILDQLQE